MKLPLPIRLLSALSHVAPTVAGRLAARLFTRPRRHTAKPPELVAARGAREERLEGGIRLLHFGERGPRVLAIHGWEGRATQLAPLATRLASAGLRVTVIDAPAHGGSTGKIAHPVAFARTIARVARHLGDVEALVGHSMGGGAVLLAARDEGVAVAAVALIAAPSSFGGVLERFVRVARLSPRAARTFFDRMAEIVGRRGEELDVTRGVIAVPTIVFHDPADREVPFADARDLAAALPHGRLVVVEGAGHRRILRRPEVLEETARFLRETLAPAVDIAPRARYHFSVQPKEAERDIDIGARVTGSR